MQNSPGTIPPPPLFSLAPLALVTAFEPAYVQPVQDSRHLYNTLDYILGQMRHHKLTWDPLGEATTLPDLLGLRLIGRYTVSNIRRLLPRVTRDRLVGHLNVTRLEPADGPPERVVEATLAATALSDLQGNLPEVVLARRAVVQLLDRRLSSSDLASLVGLSPRSIFRLRNGPVDPELIQAIRLQLGLMEALGELPGDDSPYTEESGVEVDGFGNR